MAINIHHTYTTPVEVTYNSVMSQHIDDLDLDEIAEVVTAHMIAHCFDWADVCAANTGEVLMTIERT